MLRAADTTCKTDTGRQRRDNEDNAYARAPVFVVADGMGGAQAGEVASRIAIEAFFARHADRFSWSPPDGGCVCYPRYLGAEGVEEFCRAAVEDGSVLLLPASVYASPQAPLPADRFRVGIGRADAPDALAALEEFLTRRG